MEHTGYLITIDGKQIVDGSTEKISLSTLGSFKKEGDRFYICYDETQATGFEGDTTTLLVESNSRATLTRSGKTSSELIIEKDHKHLCHYDTGLGSLVVGIRADRINNRLNEHGGELLLRYSLDLNSNAVSTNELLINVRRSEII